MNRKYQLLDSGRSAAEVPSENWQKICKTEILCRCGSPKAQLIEQVELKEDPIGLLVNSIGLGPCGLIQKSFAVMLGDLFFEACNVVPVVQGGKILEDYLAYLPKQDRTIILRGSPSSMLRKCDICRQIVYVPLGTKYLLKQQVVSMQDFYMTQRFPIIISDRIADRLQGQAKKCRTSLVIQPDPDDELPVDLADVPDHLIRNFA